MSKLLHIIDANGKLKEITISDFFKIVINKGDSILIEECIKAIHIAISNDVNDVKIIFNDSSIIILQKLARLINENKYHDEIKDSINHLITNIKFINENNKVYTIENILNLQLIAYTAYKTHLNMRDELLNTEDHLEFSFGNLSSLDMHGADAITKEIEFSDILSKNKFHNKYLKTAKLKDDMKSGSDDNSLDFRLDIEEFHELHDKKFLKKMTLHNGCITINKRYFNNTPKIIQEIKKPSFNQYDDEKKTNITENLKEDNNIEFTLDIDEFHHFNENHNLEKFSLKNGCVTIKKK